MIPRSIEDLVLSSLTASRKLILVLGARQVGKTTLIKDIGSALEGEGRKVLYLNCDLSEDITAINTASKAVLERLLVLPKADVLLIDEAQRLDNPGLSLKIIHDNFPQVRVLATGSSSFDLKNKLSDPLTGRYLDFTLYPFSFTEVLGLTGSANEILLKNRANELLPHAVLYGLYPEVYLETNIGQKQILLGKLVESYLFKDILTFQRVKNAQAIKDLTKALAYQIGSEVNENELSRRLKIDRKTVVSYLDVLEKAYVIVSAHPYSKNPRREIGKNYKIYFVDLGIRNALIGDFNPITLRADLGAVWENFLFMERRKLFANSQKSLTSYFWRSYSGSEVDYIEKISNKDIQAFEFKYRGASLSKGAGSFISQYNTEVKLVNKENYLGFLQAA
ncbi:ATP-binding protein [Patescibacteria group bacterium]|nr:ATP-binding protein [Patescibacteria group bacterium]MCL5010259.1 ATP-binding protein [Patescibacteria group bacterium]